MRRRVALAKLWTSSPEKGWINPRRWVALVDSERAICTRVQELTHGLDRGSTISEPLARPIATKVAMDRTRSCDHEHDRSEYFNSIATSFANEFLTRSRWGSRASRLLATMLASEPGNGEGRTKPFVTRDDDREWVAPSANNRVRTQRELQWTIACSIATAIATNKRIFVRESERSPLQGDLHGRIESINQKDVCESEPIHGNEDCHWTKRESTNN